MDLEIEEVFVKKNEYVVNHFSDNFTRIFAEYEKTSGIDLSEYFVMYLEAFIQYEQSQDSEAIKEGEQAFNLIFYCIMQTVFAPRLREGSIFLQQYFKLESSYIALLKDNFIKIQKDIFHCKLSLVISNLLSAKNNNLNIESRDILFMKRRLIELRGGRKLEEDEELEGEDEKIGRNKSFVDLKRYKLEHRLCLPFSPNEIAPKINLRNGNTPAHYRPDRIYVISSGPRYKDDLLGAHAAVVVESGSYIMRYELVHSTSTEKPYKGIKYFNREANPTFQINGNSPELELYKLLDMLPKKLSAYVEAIKRINLAFSGEKKQTQEEEIPVNKLMQVLYLVANRIVQKQNIGGNKSNTASYSPSRVKQIFASVFDDAYPQFTNPFTFIKKLVPALNSAPYNKKIDQYLKELFGAEATNILTKTYRKNTYKNYPFGHYAIKCDSPEELAKTRAGLMLMHHTHDLKLVRNCFGVVYHVAKDELRNFVKFLMKESSNLPIYRTLGKPLYQSQNDCFTIILRALKHIGIDVKYEMGFCGGALELLAVKNPRSLMPNDPNCYFPEFGGKERTSEYQTKLWQKSISGFGYNIYKNGLQVCRKGWRFFSDLSPTFDGCNSIGDKVKKCMKFYVEHDADYLKLLLKNEFANPDGVREWRGVVEKLLPEILLPLIEAGDGRDIIFMKYLLDKLPFTSKLFSGAEKISDMTMLQYVLKHSAKNIAFANAFLSYRRIHEREPGKVICTLNAEAICRSAKNGKYCALQIISENRMWAAIPVVLKRYKTILEGERSGMLGVVVAIARDVYMAKNIIGLTIGGKKETGIEKALKEILETPPISLLGYELYLGKAEYSPPRQTFNIQ